MYHSTMIQESGGHSCPVIVVSCPELSGGNPQTYRARIQGGDPSVTPTFKWASSAGKITGGQGTPAVVVDTDGNNYMTVTVEVGGYPASCKTKASCSWIVGRASSRKVDEYGHLSFADERARLDQFAEELQKEPTAQGYILVYAGKRSSKGKSKRDGNRAKNYLVKERGIEGARIVSVDGGHGDERMVELFIVPAGAEPPIATPKVQPREVGVRGSERRVRL